MICDLWKVGSSTAIGASFSAQVTVEAGPPDDVQVIVREDRSKLMSVTDTIPSWCTVIRTN
jgi:hypothetical protein